MSDVNMYSSGQKRLVCLLEECARQKPGSGEPCAEARFPRS